MRAVFIGASILAVTCARSLLERGHEVVIVERDEDIIKELSLKFDCGFIHGDGSRPAILREAGPEESDALFCLTDHEQANIIASLVGRSLGFKRVVTKINDTEFEHVCMELGLEDTIVPARTVARHLADSFEGQDSLELSTMIRGDARVYSFVVDKDRAGPIAGLKLPEQTSVACLYRGDRLVLPDADAQLKADDEVVLLCHRDQLGELQALLSPSSTD